MKVRDPGGDVHAERSAGRIRSWAFGVLLLGLAGLAGACGGARGTDLGTTSTPCFHALPVATAAVDHRGRLAGVRLLSLSRLRERAPALAGLGGEKVCLVAFEGSFDASRVRRALPASAAHGRFAVVAVSEDGRRVLGSLVTERLPVAFRHPV